MTKPLNPVDEAGVQAWFAEPDDPPRETRQAVEHHRTLFSYVAKAVLRDLPPSFDRDRALERLREAWSWARDGLLRHGPNA